MRELLETNNEGVPFYHPFGSSELLKAVEEDGKWTVYLEASNESLDQDGEITVMKALKDASDYYLTHGVISWDHLHKIKKDPAFIIGEPTDVAFTKHNSTLVKGFLYKENKNAQGVWNNLLSKTTRLGSSVGGYILKKALEGSQKYIKRVLWDETAITYKPVLDTTLGNVQILPFAEFAKALMVGNGVNAANFSGGRALIGEDLQGTMIKPITLKDIKGWKDMEIDKSILDLLMSGFLSKVQSGCIKTMQDVKWYVEEYRLKDAITNQISEFLINKINKQSA
jgi:hypothetical protein